MLSKFPPLNKRFGFKEEKGVDKVSFGNKVDKLEKEVEKLKAENMEMYKMLVQIQNQLLKDKK